MTLLERAILLAVTHHAGQQDKAGAPYILHPLRVMLRMNGELARVTAVLHDTLEDTELSLEALRQEGFPEEVLDALQCLTRRAGEPYEHFIERIARNPLAVQVKLGDLEDNMDTRRIPSLTEKDVERLKKYHRAWQRLKGLKTFTAESAEEAEKNH